MFNVLALQECWLYVGCFDFPAAIVNAILNVDLWAMGDSATKYCSSWKLQAANLASIVLALSIIFSVITHVVLIRGWPSSRTVE